MKQREDLPGRPLLVVASRLDAGVAGTATVGLALSLHEGDDGLDGSVGERVPVVGIGGRDLGGCEGAGVAGLPLEDVVGVRDHPPALRRGLRSERVEEPVAVRARDLGIVRSGEHQRPSMVRPGGGLERIGEQQLAHHLRLPRVRRLAPEHASLGHVREVGSLGVGQLPHRVPEGVELTVHHRHVVARLAMGVPELLDRRLSSA